MFDDTDIQEVDLIAAAIWPWLRHWWEPRNWTKLNVRQKSQARFMAWAALATSRKWDRRSRLNDGEDFLEKSG